MKRQQSGVAIVEFALVLPLLLILTFITTEYGRALYQYNTLAKSVRDAARYMSVQSPSDTTSYAAARNLVVYGNPAGSGTPLVHGITTSMVPNPVWELHGTDPVIRTVTVQIGYGTDGSTTRYKFIPMISDAFGLSLGSITFGPISATMRGAL